MSTIALNNLWNYIQSLALSNSNKDWLASKLIESKVEDIDEEAPALRTQEQQEEYVRQTLTRAILECREDIRTGKKLQSARELLEEMKTW
ncbi:MAG: hypothetical protein IJV06_09715 [Bacteroidaceae bacterium]|nr:hypothetical protein [Bacteroidaceae bacterium]